MKVNTDGCLLGAWASAKSPKRILDIGAGSGVIALMLAQKYPEAIIDGIEIETICAKQCEINFSNSPFYNRLQSHNLAFQDFKTDAQFDLIVSNPPYFSNDTPSAETKRHQARHQIGLSVEELILKTSSLLTANGKFCLILPLHLRDNAVLEARKSKLHLNEEVALSPLPDKKPHRVLLAFSPFEDRYISSEESIELARGEYSPTITKWLKPYYLNL